MVPTRPRHRADKVTDWHLIEAALKDARLALKLPQGMFSPHPVTATGTTVSPPLFESLELPGRDRMQRLRGAPAGRHREPCVANLCSSHVGP